MDARDLTLGFVGAGAMGRPMIDRLHAAGHRVIAYARRDEVAADLRAHGIEVGPSPAAVAAAAPIVFINVTATADVESVLFGDHGIARGARPGTVVIDHSTISAEATRAFEQRLAAQAVAFLDAPVSGGVQGAQAGTLSIMVGGDLAAFERMRPLFEVLGRTITHIGPSGAGQIAKACNQIVQVVNIQGIAEAMHFARAQGVDLGRVLTAISAGMAGSKMLDLMGPKMVRRAFEAGIEARLHAKDIAIVADLAASLGLDLPAVDVVARQCAALLEHGWGHDDTSSLLRVLEGGMS